MPLIGPGNLSRLWGPPHWDQISRLQERHDLRTSHQERFGYDGRNRLTLTEARQGNGSWSVQQRQRYDLSGNILCKSDVPGSSLSCALSSHQNYTYGSARPHAVTQAGNRTFTYDNNGNVVEDRVNGSLDRQFVYTSFDLLRRVSRNNRHTEFHYGGNRARMLRRELTGTTVTERVHYIGGTEVIWPGVNPGQQQATFRRDVAGVALVTVAANGQAQLRYPHRDHLGSVVAISDAFGQVVARMGFDAWGARRDVQQPNERWLQWLNPISPAWAGDMLAITPKGYTHDGFSRALLAPVGANRTLLLACAGHEHVDHHGIIHMNGRIYDPLLARFLQADPFIEDTGTLNRYTYVHNNPLVYTDPSGYFSIRKWARTALSIGVAVASGWGVAYLLKQSLTGWAFMAAVAGGAASGGIATGTMEGVMWGAFSGAVFFGVGQAFGGTAGKNGLWGSSFKDAGELARASLAHGVAGGTISQLQGGKFGHGFVSAGVSKSFSTRISGAFDGNALAQGTATAIVGGTTSRLTGGKFANGAVTAAMAFAFNQAVTAAKRRSEDRQLSEERIVGSGEVRVYSASGYGGGGGRIEMDLSIDVYNSAGSLIGYYDLEMSAIVGGPGISLRNIRKTSIGVIRFDTVLKGPPIGNLTSIYQAFDNQPVVMSGGTAVLGVGISAGTFRIGNHYDPAQVIAAHGLGGGFSHFSGHMNVNSVKFRPRDFR